MTKKKKHTLEFDVDYDYDMIGISSPNNDYRIVWAMNELLNIITTRFPESPVNLFNKSLSTCPLCSSFKGFPLFKLIKVVPVKL